MAQRYQLTFEVQDDEREPVIRLRALLKIALKSFGFRCIRISEPGEAEQSVVKDEGK